MSKTNGQWRLGKKWLAMIKLCCTGLFLLLTFTCAAQSITATLDRDKILLGEQVTLTLQVQDINARLSTLQWQNLPDTFNHIEIVNRGLIDSGDAGGLTNYTQKIILTSFDSGRWQLPELKMTLTANDNKQTVIKATPLFIDVLPVDVSNLKDYHPIKDIIEVQVKKNILLIVALVAGGVLLLFGLWWFLFRKKKPAPVVAKPKDNLTNYQRAMKQIQWLQEQSLPAKQFYQQLDDIYRTYFDEELDVKTMQSTTDELMVTMKLFLPDDKIRTGFYQLVRLTSAVKYAKYLPDETRQQDVQTVFNTLGYIHQYRIKQNADRVG